MNDKLEDTQYAVLWSPSQKSHHISTVTDMLARNNRIYLEMKAGDFILLSYHETQEEAQKALDWLRQ